MIRLDIVDLPIYSISTGGNDMTNAEKSNEFGRAIHYCELVNEWHLENAPDVNSTDPADTANNMLQLYFLKWNTDTNKYEIKLKELV